MAQFIGRFLAALVLFIGGWVFFNGASVAWDIAMWLTVSNFFFFPLFMLAIIGGVIAITLTFFALWGLFGDF